VRSHGFRTDRRTAFRRKIIKRGFALAPPLTSPHGDAKFSRIDCRSEGDSAMEQTDWAKLYAAMDQRLNLKYEQLPKGEQTGKRPGMATPPVKNS
jgi:hypothetical protein